MKRIRVSAAVLAAACLLAASGADAFPGGGSGGSMGRGGPGGGRGGPPSFDELDADGDGVVTENEFFAPMLEHHAERFTMMDQNGDGTLTSDEIGSGRPQGRRQR